MVDAVTLERLALSLPEAAGGSHGDRASPGPTWDELLGLLWGGWRAVAPRVLVKRIDGG